MDFVMMPKVLEKVENEEEANFYEKEELIEFLECAKKEVNFKAYVLFRLLAFSGFRKGEALALTWSDIDFNKNTIRVNKALARGKDGLILQPPKNKKSNRVVDMDEKTLSILKEWKSEQKVNLKILSLQNLKKKQLVFNNQKNEFTQPSKTTRWLTHIQNKYGLRKITTHGLRHTHCSLCFEAGMSMKEVQDRLGHKLFKRR